MHAQIAFGLAEGCRNVRRLLPSVFHKRSRREIEPTHRRSGGEARALSHVCGSASCLGSCLRAVFRVNELPALSMPSRSAGREKRCRRSVSVPEHLWDAK